MRKMSYFNINFPTEILFKILNFFIKGINIPNDEKIIKKNIDIIKLVCRLWYNICVDNHFKNSINYFINFKYNELINYNNIDSLHFGLGLNSYYWKNKLICYYNVILDNKHQHIIDIYYEKNNSNNSTEKLNELILDNGLYFKKICTYSSINIIKVIYLNNLLFIIEKELVYVFNIDKIIDKSYINFTDYVYSFIDSNKIKKIIQLDINTNLFSTIGNNHIKIWKYNIDTTEFDKYIIQIDNCEANLNSYNDLIIDNIEVNDTFICNNHLLYKVNNLLLVIYIGIINLPQTNLLNRFVIKYISNCDYILSYKNKFIVVFNYTIKLLTIENNKVSIINLKHQILETIIWFTIKYNTLILLCSYTSFDNLNNIIIKQKLYNIKLQHNQFTSINQLELNNDIVNDFNLESDNYNILVKKNNIYYFLNKGLFIINIINFDIVYITYPINVEISLLFNQYIFLSDGKVINIYLYIEKNTYDTPKLILIK
ncbi:MAG: hypothetical protein KIT69_09165, partial [Propionibacteriaceae bacterium]|nr:hypothetical protein [Propionibacteriaceae bacterium]